MSLHFKTLSRFVIAFLNVHIPKSSWWNLTPNVMVSDGEPLWGGWWGWSPQHGISILVKEAPESSSPSLQVRTQREDTVYEPGSRSLADRVYWTLDLRSKHLLLICHPVMVVGHCSLKGQGQNWNMFSTQGGRVLARGTVPFSPRPRRSSVYGDGLHQRRGWDVQGRTGEAEPLRLPQHDSRPPAIPVQRREERYPLRRPCWTLWFRNSAMMRLAQQQEISDPETWGFRVPILAEDRKVTGPLRTLAMSWGCGAQSGYGWAFPVILEDPSAILLLTHCLTSISFCPSWSLWVMRLPPFSVSQIHR